MPSSFRKLIPEPVKIPVRVARRNLATFRKSWANARAAFHPGETLYRLEIGRFGGFEVAFRKGTADELVICDSFDNDVYFAVVPEIKLAPDAVVIDIGSHIGTFALLAASKAPQGRVFAIDASRETFNYLRVNIALNSAANIDASHMALSDRKGTVVLHHDEGNWGHTIMKEFSARGEEVQADTLAAFMESKGIDRVDFIKFNCEGAEFPILLSTPVELLKKIGMMLVLYHCDLVEHTSPNVLLARLHEAGFKTEIRNKDAIRGWIIATR